MQITAIDIKNFRSFKNMDQSLEFGPITVLIGANNAGKSSILKAIHAMQEGVEISPLDVRIGTTKGSISIGLTEIRGVARWGTYANAESARLDIQLTGSQDRRSIGIALQLSSPGRGVEQVRPLLAHEPEHFVIPYLSKRKTANYSEDVRQDHALAISSSLMYLAAKLSRISNPSFPGHVQYRDTCTEILGFMVTAIPSQNGQRPGAYLTSTATLPIDQMGEGVPNIVGLLADLALSEGKLFLIEEPENDLHPAALKALLALVLESSSKNQFVISTHSNIVVSYLCSTDGSRLYSVNSTRGKLPLESTVVSIDPTPEARLSVLRDLGYSFSDFELWDGWLVLEESSAERLIRDYLIPWFVPKLARVRTLSTNGVNQIQATFEDFNRLVRFTHLEDAYKGAAWVRTDGDESGQVIVAELRRRYSTWEPSHFSCFSQPQFEHYYPNQFRDRVAETLAIPDKKQKREAKRLLLDDVRVWLDQDAERAKAALLASAKEVIDDLASIAQSLGR